MTFTEYASDGFRAVASATHVLEGVALAPHDCVVTEHYILLKINALTLDQLSFLSGAGGPAECLDLDGRAPVRAFVFPRPTLAAADRKEFVPFAVRDIPACFSIHFSHGYEDEQTGNIVSFFSVSSAPCHSHSAPLIVFSDSNLDIFTSRAIGLATK